MEQERARLILITPTCNPSLDIHDLFGDSSREIQEIIKREIKSPAGRTFEGALHCRRGEVIDGSSRHSLSKHSPNTLSR